MSLPVTVTYGAVAWKLAGALVALIGLVAVRVFRARRSRGRARAAVARRMVEVTAPVLARTQGVAAVTGLLRGGVAATLAVGDRAFHDRAGELYLDYKGERVELAAPLHVVFGTVASSSRGLPSATPRAIRGALARELDGGSRVSRVLRRAAGGRVYRFAQLSDGDAVIVRGILGKRGGVDRFGVRTYLLEPEPGRDELEIAAVSPAAPAMPLRWYSAVALAALLAGGAIAGMVALGAHELAAGRAEPAPAALGALDPLAIAAAMPGSRDEALAELARRYPALRTRLARLP